MTQVPDGSVGQGMQPPAPVAPAPAAAAPAPAAPGAQDEFIQVQRAQFAPYGGDMHEVSRLAKLGQQAEQERLFELGQAISGGGMTVPQTIDIFSAPPEAEPQQTAAPQQGAYPYQQPASFQPAQAMPAQGYPPQAPHNPQQQPPMDQQAMFQQLMAQNQKSIQDGFAQQRTLSEQANRQQVMEQARQSEAGASNEFAKALGCEIPSDGSGNPKLNIVRGEFNRALETLKAERVPVHIADRDQWMERFDEPCSDDLLAKATENAKKNLTDFAGENIATFAEQQTTAGGLQTSLGEGAGGTSPPDPDSMTRDQEIEAVAGHVQDT